MIDTLIGRIASGDLLPGAMLPSEAQLGKDLGVSQGTARKALMELEARGLVQRRQGRGSFVTVRTPETSMFNFFRLRAPDGTLTPPHLESEVVVKRPATAHETAKLFGAPEDVIEIVRIRSLNSRNATHEVLVVPARLFPGLQERAPLPNAIYVLYQQAYSVIILKAEEQLRIGAASASAARAFGLDEGAPVLKIYREAIDFLDRTVELRTVQCLTQTHRYCITLSQPAET
ncbi:GntR family transcriptional regulator [Salipiger sp. PrR002]|uniref:GntR family transcriptional regulator n=1 Tax=Salipiger sp. PrR002 TaxID=2706489 RepID=UPI0034CD94E8